MSDGTELATRVWACAKADALDQCWDHEIVQGLVDECALDHLAAWEWVEGNAAQLERWRHLGQRNIRKELRDHSRGLMPDENKATANATLLRLAEQYLAGWSREPVAEKVQKALAKALKEAAKTGQPKGLRVA